MISTNQRPKSYGRPVIHATAWRRWILGPWVEFALVAGWAAAARTYRIGIGQSAGRLRLSSPRRSRRSGLLFSSLPCTCSRVQRPAEIDRSTNRPIRILPFRLTASFSSATPPPPLGFYFGIAVAGGCYPPLSLSRLPRSRSRSRSRRSRSSLKPYRPTAACSGREPELALRWRCSTWRRSGRRARTSPTGTPPSPTSTSGSYGTSSPSSSTNSYSSRPHRFASFSSSSLCPAAFLILGLVKA